MHKLGNGDQGGDKPSKKKDSSKERNPKQDKKLSEGEIENLKKKGVWDHGEKGMNGKGGGYKDLWKDKDGNVYEKPKNGSGPGEPIGINLNNLSVKAAAIGVGTSIIYGGIKVLDWVSSRVVPIFMITPLMMQQHNPNHLYNNYNTETY